MDVKAFVRKNHLINPVLVDSTSNESLAMSYVNYLEEGFNIVTPNKKANTDSWEYYQALRSAAQKSNRRFLYETTVGAGLPVIDTLQNLIKASPQETSDLEGAPDPGKQMSYSPLEGLIHKYELGLIYVVDTCSAHCRFCYREELIARKEIKREGKMTSFYIKYRKIEDFFTKIFPYKRVVWIFP